MRWFKFLAPDAVGPFSGYRWPAPQEHDGPGEWVTANQPAEPCRGGLHLLREADLPFWLHEELYTVDVEGAVEEHPSFVLARRARLVHRVGAWGQESAYRFSRDCAWRVRDLTVEALRGAGHHRQAELMARCAALDELVGAAQQAGDSIDAGLATLVGYAADAAAYAASAERASGWAAVGATTGFIAATAARHAPGQGTGQAGPTTEREAQAHWIARLAVAPG
jgi:hypothetical protein